MSWKTTSRRTGPPLGPPLEDRPARAEPAPKAVLVPQSELEPIRGRLLPVGCVSRSGKRPENVGPFPVVRMEQAREECRTAQHHLPGGVAQMLFHGRIEVRAGTGPAFDHRDHGRHGLVDGFEERQAVRYRQGIKRGQGIRHNLTRKRQLHSRTPNQGSLDKQSLPCQCDPVIRSEEREHSPADCAIWGLSAKPRDPGPPHSFVAEALDGTGPHPRSSTARSGSTVQRTARSGGCRRSRGIRGFPTHS